MPFSDIWAVLKDAGPLTLFAFATVMWWLERKRADDERKINEDRTTKFYEVTNSISATLITHSNTMDKALDVFRRHEWDRK